MYLLVAYDVSTASPAGERRLRKVARVCQDYGCRVQNSVFEVALSETLLPTFRTALLDAIDPAFDNLRIYRLHGSFSAVVEKHGIDKAVDFEEPLIV
jgi:CRISPR-associated protein Cas2